MIGIIKCPHLQKFTITQNYVTYMCEVIWNASSLNQGLLHFHNGGVGVEIPQQGCQKYSKNCEDEILHDCTMQKSVITLFLVTKI